MKEDLDALRDKLAPIIGIWASQGLCPTKFLACLTSDLREVETKARAKVNSRSLKNFTRCINSYILKMLLKPDSYLIQIIDLSKDFIHN